ncbi:MAG: hypothetical protein GTO41_28670 [Burkholderiales bacterium]|nr:hypothetical protein [Burkholderiales bacterium]
MADQQSSEYDFKLVVTETKDVGLDKAANPPLVHTLGRHAGTLTASTSIPVKKTYSDTIPLVAGSASIDLTNLPGPLSTTITFSGLKVQQLKIVCPDTNSGGITFDVAIANGYNLFGADNASDESVEVMPGALIQMQHNNNIEDVDATHKAITVTGTGTDTFDIILTAG